MIHRFTRDALRAVADEQGLNEKDAAGEIADSDANRPDYVSRFFGEKDELLTDYDNRLSTGAAAAVVVAATAQPAPATV